MNTVEVLQPDIGRHLIQRMAVRSWVRPTSLLADMPGEVDLINLLTWLLPFCEVGVGQKAGMWRLGEKPRRAAFRAWNLAGVLAEIEHWEGDNLTRALARALGTLPLELRMANVEELSDVRAVMGWIPPNFPPPAWTSTELDQAIEQARIRSDLANLTKHSVIGRDILLRRLHEAVFANKRTPVVSIVGSGGSGKSTLLAKFLSDIFDIMPRRLAILRMDFDRADINPNRGTTLDRALIEQIGRAVPEMREVCFNTSRNIVHFAAGSRSLSEYVEQGYMDDNYVSSAPEDSDSAGATFKSELFSIFHTLEKHVNHVVLAFDTFERVEASGTLAVEGVLRWVQGLLEVVPLHLSLIVASRAELMTTYPLMEHQVRLRLGDLSLVSARKLLLQRGCPSDITNLLVKHLPKRTPLILHLAAESVNSADPANRAELVRTLEQGDIPSELISGYLYDRILVHVDRPHLRRFAHAAMALPELSRDLVRAVLIPEVEPDYVGDLDALANEVFGALASMRWLTSATSGERLRLRPDLRSLVLTLLNSDKQSRSLIKNIRLRALKYHFRTNLRNRAPWHNAMALYHRILLMQSRGATSHHLASLLTQVEEHAQYLIPFSDDLPDVIRLTLSQRDGNQVNLEAAMELLNMEEWAKLMDGASGTQGQGHQIVTRQDPLVAYELYLRRPTRPRGLPPAYAIQAACDTGRWHDLEVNVPDACQHLGYQFRESRRWGPHLLHLAALLRLTMLRGGEEEHEELYGLVADIIVRCRPYGTALAIGETVAIAECFHGRHYFYPEFGSDLAPGDLANRMSWLRLRFWHLTPLNVPVTAAVIGYDRSVWELVVARANNSDPMRKVADEGRYLDNRSYAAFHRVFRQLQKSPIGRNETLLEHADRLALPEFYRPLRQALHEAYSDNSEATHRLSISMQGLFREVPREMKAENFPRFLAADPLTWYFALVQYADRCRVLPSLLEHCIEHAPPNANRLRMVCGTYMRWVDFLSNRPATHRVPF